jgi:dihydrofolate synthase/folylpolyglutamate synthase
MDHYQRTLEELFVRTTQGIKLGLDNTLALLEALDRPDRVTANILVAGTNGKGSTSSLLAHTLQACGYRVGLYTSPHLLRYTERIRINSSEVSRNEAVELYEHIKKVEHKLAEPPTFFEATTAMAMLAFARAQVDIAILEVGLGGRLDSTNAAERMTSVITPIALDHCHLLGTDLTSIAREKAGIIRQNTPVVTSPQSPEAMRVIAESAKAASAPLYRAPEPDYREDGLLIAGDSLRHPLRIEPWTRPSFQGTNLSTVATTLQALSEHGFECAPEALPENHQSWSWPGRFQELSGTPTVLLDGAHNPAAMLSLRESVARFAAGRPVHVVFSALGTKDLTSMLDILHPIAESIRLTPSSVHRSLSASDLTTMAEPHRVCRSPNEALEDARERALRDGGMVLVTGSLFLVADALQALTSVERDPAVAS